MDWNIASLSLRDKAAQLVFARIGSNMQPAVTVEEDEARVKALLERCALGGLVLFNGSLPQTARMLEGLQRRSRFPLLVAADIERGVGQQVQGGTVFPHAMAYSALGAEAAALLETSARVTAREALACGLHLSLSPVADVHRNPRNPIISTRAFSTTPEGAARLVEAYIRGCRSEGLLTTAKHFPGHGSTSEDSHATIPRVESTREELEQTDLVPFRAAVAAGVDLVMTAHVVYPALDPEARPATLSRPILHDLLRGALGFAGPVISDSLLMGAMRNTHADVGAQAVALFEAGADIILDPLDPEQVVDGLVRAVAAGELEESALDRSLRRVWKLKQQFVDRFGADCFTDLARHFPVEDVGAPAHRRLAEEVAGRAVTLVGGAASGMLPIDSERAGEEGMLVLLVKPHRSRLDPPEAPLGEAVRSLFPTAVYREVGPEAEEDALRALQAEAGRVRHVVVALVVKPAAWYSYGLQPAQQQFLERLIAQRDVILASLGSPDVLGDFPGAAAHLCTYSDVAPSQRALAAALAGGLDF